jgi:hypothetical protein
MDALSSPDPCRVVNLIGYFVKFDAHVSRLRVANGIRVDERYCSANRRGTVAILRFVRNTAAEDLLRAFEAVQEGNPYLSHDLALKVALARTRHDKARLPS